MKKQKENHFDVHFSLCCSQTITFPISELDLVTFWLTFASLWSPFGWATNQVWRPLATLGPPSDLPGAHPDETWVPLVPKTIPWCLLTTPKRAFWTNFEFLKVQFEEFQNIFWNIWEHLLSTRPSFLYALDLKIPASSSYKFRFWNDPMTERSN